MVPKAILSVSIATIFLLSCGEKNFDQQSYEQHKESIAGKEKKKPLLFLSVTGYNKKNIIGQTVIYGKIVNKATVCAYKDVRIKMLCFKNNKIAEEHEDIVNNIIKANSITDFKTRYRL